jgi:hypothetical protein
MAQEIKSLENSSKAQTPSNFNSRKLKTESEIYKNKIFKSPSFTTPSLENHHSQNLNNPKNPINQRKINIQQIKENSIIQLK